MRTVFFISMLLLFFCGTTTAQDKTKPAYDSTLAKKLGADDYGMKMYTMVILTTGKADIKEKALRDSLFSGHMTNIGKLAKEGKLVLAGPFGKNDIHYRGVFIFNTASIDETKNMVATDPAVKAGIFDAVYLPWYCSAGLMEVNGIHEKIQKIRF